MHSSRGKQRTLFEGATATRPATDVVPGKHAGMHMSRTDHVHVHGRQLVRKQLLAALDYHCRTNGSRTPCSRARPDSCASAGADL